MHVHVHEALAAYAGAEPRKPRSDHSLAQHRRWMEKLGNGGFLTWRSSPTVMWLVHQLRTGGQA